MRIKRFLPFLLAFLLPVLGIYAWWGGFNQVRIQSGVRGPYVYAYLESTGDYSKVPEAQSRARAELDAQGIAMGHAITVLLSNPEVVNVNERRARAGYLVPAGAQVREPLKLDYIGERSVVMAQVEAGALLAPSRAYQALDGFLQKQGKGIRMPTVEIYESSGVPWRMGVLTVESEI